MKPMTKSLHTITVVKNVAQYLHFVAGPADFSSPAQLTSDALAILGYTYSPAALDNTRDVTLVRSVNAVRAMLEQKEV